MKSEQMVRDMIHYRKETLKQNPPDKEIMEAEIQLLEFILQDD